MATWPSGRSSTAIKVITVAKANASTGVRVERVEPELPTRKPMPSMPNVLSAPSRSQTPPGRRDW